jgi:hypothetical protein
LPGKPEVALLPPLFVNSMPKSGTNLVQTLAEDLGYRYSGRSLAASSVSGRYRAVKRLLRKNFFSMAEVPVGIEFDASVSARWVRRYFLAVHEGAYLSGHSAYSDVLYHLLQRAGIKTILVLRNPADVVLSMANYIVEPINAWYPFHSKFKSLSVDERARYLVSGGNDATSGGYLRSLKEQYRSLEGWCGKENVLIVHFEELVGVKGGGSHEAQREALKKIANFIGLEEKKVFSVGSNIYGRSHTFRQGKIGKGEAELGSAFNQLLNEQLAGNLLFH